MKKVKLLSVVVALGLLVVACETETKSKGNDGVEVATMSADASKEASKGEIVKAEKSKPMIDDEKLILKLKEVFDISNDYDEVDISHMNMENDSILSVSWNNTINGDSIYARIDKYGNIISYDNYNNTYTIDNEKYTLPKYNKASAKKITDELMSKALGEYVNNFKFDEDDSFRSDRTSYTMSYQRYVEDIPVKNSSMNITIDLVDGKIKSLNYSNYEDYDYTDESLFEKPKKTIDEAEAQKLYKENNKLFLNARRVMNYDSKSLYPSISYKLTYETFGQEKQIDAVTGKAEQLLGFFGVYEDSMMSAAESMNKDDSVLTKDEKERLEAVKSTVTIEEAEKKAKELFEIEGSMKMTSSRLSNYNSSKDDFIWNMEFNDGNGNWISVGLDAKDLSLLNFYKSGETKIGNNEELSRDEAVKIATAFVNKHNKNIINELEMVEPTMGNSFDNSVSISFVRKLDDDFYLLQDNITLNVNANSKSVDSYNKTWYKNYNEKLGAAKLNVDEAYDIVFDKYDYTKNYSMISEKNKVVGYKQYYSNFGINYGGVVIDAVSGTVLSHDGKVVYENGDEIYEDLEKSSDSKKVQKLFDFGVSYDGNTLRPEEKVKQEDLVRVLYQSKHFNTNTSDIDIDNMYESLISDDILDEEEVNKEALVTKKEISKYLVRMSGLEIAANLNDVYKNIFEDAEELGEYKGYMTLATRLGFIEIENDMAEPNKNISRDDVLMYLYNYLFEV